MLKRFKTKFQNWAIFAVLATSGIVLSFNFFNQANNNIANVQQAEFKVLDEQLKSSVKTLSRYYQETFNSLGQLFYDSRIKKAVLTRNTRLFGSYQQKANHSLRDFALFKDINNIYMFDEKRTLISGVNRTIAFDESLLKRLKERLINYQNKQVIFEKINNQDMIIFITRLDFSKSSHAYIILIEDLQKYVYTMPKFDSEIIDFYSLTKNLDYQNNLLHLSNAQEITLAQQHDTLLKYNLSSKLGFSESGEITLSKLITLPNYQNVSLLAMMNPKYLQKKINQSAYKINAKYIKKFALFILLVAIFVLLVLLKINIVDNFYKALHLLKEFKQFLNQPHPTKSLKQNGILDISNQAKQQAYSYIHNEEALKSSMFNVYNNLKSMAPEDIRNMSIKNSLSKENIRLVYQPIVDSKTMIPQFCEVFLRLLNYYGEELMPSEFIPVLNHFNMLENLDEMMLEKIVNKVQSLQNHDSSAKISINISKGAFNSDKFLEKINQHLTNNNIKTENIMLELPFIELIQDERAEQFIQKMISLNISFAVSISTADPKTISKIIKNKIQYIKIDMMHFADVLNNTEKQNVLKEILANAKKNNLTIIAERIETEIMFKLAKSLEIPLLQGYYISKPKKYYTHK